MDRSEYFGRYLLEKRLAGHAFAEVFMARVELPGGETRPLVIKRTVHELVGEGLTKALVEPAARAAMVNDPHVVALFEIGQHDKQSFVAMELVEGPSLAQLLEAAGRAKLEVPLEVQLHLVGACARAVAAAHALGRDKSQGEVAKPFIHGGLCPNNVLVGTDGQVRVTDFGVTTAALDTNSVPLGYYRSKLPYYPPERFQGQPITELSDIYGLGLLLFELAVGRPAFGGGNDAEIIRAVCDAPAPQPRKLNKKVVEGVDKLITKALARRPQQRLKTAAVMIKELDGLLPRGAGKGVEAIAAFVAQVEQAVGETLGPRIAALGDVPSSPGEAAAPLEPSVDEPSPFADTTPAEPNGRPVPVGVVSVPDGEDTPTGAPAGFSFGDDRTVADFRIDDIRARLAQSRAEESAPGGGFDETTTVAFVPNLARAASSDEPGFGLDPPSVDAIVDAVGGAEEEGDAGGDVVADVRVGSDVDAESEEASDADSDPTVDVAPDSDGEREPEPIGDIDIEAIDDVDIQELIDDTIRAAVVEPLEAVSAGPAASTEGGGSDLADDTEEFSTLEAAELDAPGGRAQAEGLSLWQRLASDRRWVVGIATAALLVVALVALGLMRKGDEPRVTSVEPLMPSETALLAPNSADPVGVPPASPMEASPIEFDSALGASTEVVPAPTGGGTEDSPERELVPNEGEVPRDTAPEPRSTDWGVVALSSEPPAEIVLRGRKLGHTPKDLRLLAGSYRVTLVNEADQQSKTVTITAKAGARVEEKVRFGSTEVAAKVESAGKGSSDEGAGKPSDASANPGMLLITVKPWADVYVDGLKVGTTPLPPLPLAPGPHTVDLENPELGKSKRLPIKIRAGKPLKVKVDLNK